MENREKHIREPTVEYAELVAATQREAEAAQGYLDEDGCIDYGRFTIETLGLFVTGPGPVREPAEVDPIHIGTTTREFAGESNNFHTLFDESWGKRRRERQFYQRFNTLFPDFAKALMEQYSEYVSRCSSQKSPSYIIEPELFEPLRVAYGVMAQLIDENDVYHGEQLVKDIDATRLLRA